ncbi:adenylate/guanylate cyclase domain-containing protein, partial [Streptomyces sp. NPDC058418]
MTVVDSTSGEDAQPPSDSSGYPTPHHVVDHTVEPTDDPLAIRLEQLILGAERRYTPFQAARTAGVSMELASRFWRAMGFADIGQAKALTEADVLALRRLAGLVEAGLLSEPMAVQVAR